MTLYSAISGRRLQDTGNKQPLLTSRWWAGALVIACLLLVTINARDGLWNLYGRWAHEEEYGYGFLIAALMPLLLWRCWPVIVTAPVAKKWPGLAIVVIAQSCTILAALAELYYIQQIALIVSLLGIGLAVFGTGAFRAFVPLTLLMLLAVPLPYTI